MFDFVVFTLFIVGAIIGFMGIIMSNYGWAPKAYVEVFGLSFPALVMLIGLIMIISSIIVFALVAEWLDLYPPL